MSSACEPHGLAGRRKAEYGKRRIIKSGTQELRNGEGVLKGSGDAGVNENVSEANCE
jgi:hypothetical protein